MFENNRLSKIAVAMNQRETSRRQFLTTTVKLGGGAAALALAASPGVAFARHTSGKPGDKFGNGRNNDLDVLNYALTLEHFEAAFYNAGVDAFSESEWEDNLSANDFGPSVADTGYQRLIEVRDHENTHVQTLSAVITQLGGTPVPPCNYDFSSVLDDPAVFLATAAVLEDTGVKAYDGAVALIESRQILTAAASIATVEARHASYFRLLNVEDPFPAAFDSPTDPQEIINEVIGTGLVVSCPVAPPIPDQPTRCTP